jgi:hypothetical protein
MSGCHPLGVQSSARHIESSVCAIPFLSSR